MKPQQQSTDMAPDLIDIVDPGSNDDAAQQQEQIHAVTRKLEGALGEYIGQSKDLTSIATTDNSATAYGAYYGELFGNEQEGQSEHITRDVFDAVESTKARLLATFASSRNIVHYKPQGSKDIEAAAFRNALVKEIFWTDNKGYKVLHDCIHDGLLCRWYAVKYYWVEDKQNLSAEYRGTIIEMGLAIQQYADAGFEVVGQTPHPDNTMTVQFQQTIDHSRVKIEVIAPERVIVENGAESPDEASFLGEEMRITASKLAEMGVSTDMIATIDEYAPVDSATASRKKPDETSTLDTDSPTPEGTIYKVFNCFINIDLDGSGVGTLYNTLSDVNGKLLLDPVPVETPQIIINSLLPQPHKIAGESQAEIIAPIQKSSSTVMRQYIDHLSRVNTGRMAADMQLVRNPRNLLENHIGGIIDIEFIDGKPPMMDIPQPQLSPVTGVVLEELKLEKEQRGGVSRLAQGLNNDAVSNQNADSLIERMTNLSTARVMMMARGFAEMTLKPLFDGIFKIITQNDTRPRLIQIGENTTEIVPAQLRGNYSLSVEMTVTEEEAMQRAQSLLLMHNTLSADPDAAFLYPTAKRYATYSEVYKAMGESPHMFMQDPNSNEGVQSFGQMQMQLQQQGAQLQLLSQQLQASIQDGAGLREQLANKQMDLIIKNRETLSKVETSQRDQDRKDAEFAHELTQDQREYELEKTQDRGVSL